MNLDKPQAEEVKKIIETHGGIKYMEEEKVQTQTGQDKSGDSPSATRKNINNQNLSWGERCEDAEDEEMDDVEMVDAATVGEEQYRKQIQGINSTGVQEEKLPNTATQDLRGFTVVAQANTKIGQTRTSGIVPPLPAQVHHGRGKKDSCSPTR